MIAVNNNSTTEVGGKLLGDFNNEDVHAVILSIQQNWVEEEAKGSCHRRQRG
jgi:hypothetical protein